jgi:hypothetical protein
VLPFVLGGFRFPLGPDAPVYLWWIRLAGADGLSAVGHRPGVPALALALGGTLHLSVVTVVAALQVALGVAVGLASAALVRAGTRAHDADPRDQRARWLLAGALAGTFAVHLAAGYLANLAFAALFLAAAVLLCAAGRRVGVAAAMLGAAGLAHPLFGLLGLVILALAAALSWRVDRAGSRRVVAAAVGGAAVAGAGLLALLAGPAPLAVDTSRDGFLRRAGLGDVLRSAYLDRFVHRWTRYVQWASIPLAVAGLGAPSGFAGRFLRAWGITLVAGVGLALATGLAPADRFITFGFVVPILAALGLVRLWRILAPRRRALAWAVPGALTVAMLAGSWIAWDRQEPFLSPLEVERVTTAAAYAAGAPPTAPLEVVVNGEEPTLSFAATRAGNVIRAGMPPDRIRDVVIMVQGVRAAQTEERQALTDLSFEDLGRAQRASDEHTVSLLVVPFDRIDPEHFLSEVGWERVSRGVLVFPPVPEPRPLTDPLEPSSPGAIALGSLAVVLALTLIGYGWARAAGCDGWTASALAPAVGAAALVLAAITLERVGLPLTGSAGPSLVSALGGASGYLAWFVLERRAGSRPAPQVEQQPPEE